MSPRSNYSLRSSVKFKCFFAIESLDSARFSDVEDRFSNFAHEALQKQGSGQENGKSRIEEILLGKIWRRGGDLNPRYGFTPYDSLANCWFKPLTHLSSDSIGSEWIKLPYGEQ